MSCAGSVGGRGCGGAGAPSSQLTPWSGHTKNPFPATSLSGPRPAPQGHIRVATRIASALGNLRK